MIPLTYLMASAVKTFSPTAMRFSNLLSLGNVLAIHSFWSINWKWWSWQSSIQRIKIICDNSKWQQILLGSHRVSKEVPGQFPVAKRGGRQRDRRKAAGRRKLQARDGSPPKGPTWAIVHCLPVSLLPVKYPLQGWCDLVRDCSEQLP